MWCQLKGLDMCLLTLGVLVVAFVGFELFFARRSSITETNYAKIREGMSQREVENILGGPPRGWTSGRAERLGFSAALKAEIFSEEGIVGETGETCKGWIGDEVAILVDFDSSGRVVKKGLTGLLSCEESPVSKILRYLDRVF